MDQGKVRSIGVSNFSPEKVHALRITIILLNHEQCCTQPCRTAGGSMVCQRQDPACSQPGEWGVSAERVPA